VRRVVVTLLLLSVCLAIPVAVLVTRALESAVVEEENRHRAIAERAFDEMEDALSRFLAREEVRPFDAYRFYTDTHPPRRSPLSHAPEEDFVVGYWQTDPDGSIHSPRIPLDLDLAVRRGDFSPSAETRDLETQLRHAWRQAAEQPTRSLHDKKRDLHGKAATVEEEESTSSWAANEEQSARDGGRRETGEEKAERRETGEERERDEKNQQRRDIESEIASAAGRTASKNGKDEPPDSYDFYGSLNRATERRAERKQKVTTVPARKLSRARSFEFDQDEGRPLAGRTSDRRSGGPDATALASPEALRQEVQRSQAIADARAPSADRIMRLEARAARRALAPALAAAPAPAAALPLPGLADETTLRVALDPMVGRSAGDERLLLYRTVVVGQQGYRQGMLIDWRRLGAWLDAQVISPSGLGRFARISFFGRAPLSTEPREEHVYQHRFAEPFDTFGLELALPTLPGGRGTGAIYALAAMLALVAAGGLFAVYRMVAVVVHFAERRNRFVAAVSHELKTPLTSIRMYAEMLRDGLVSSERKRDEYYHTITDESERLSRLIDNVLDFSRLEKGEYEVNARPGHVLRVVEESVAKLAPHAERQGFALELSTDAELPEVRFDPDALTQVIFNLVDNALKYARTASRKEVMVDCRAMAPGVVVAVRDFGPGVPAKDLGRVFEAFYRREDELTRTTKGTGIGLALVDELVRSMGGSVEATNAAEGGLEVRVLLPSSQPPQSSRVQPRA
jgi:signal transduction histidine kinase